jgi:hypothetical protein
MVTYPLFFRWSDCARIDLPPRDPVPSQMDSRTQIDFLAILRLSLKVLKKAEPGFPLDELRRMIQARIGELNAEASLQRKSAALEIPCPVCKQRAGFPCISLPSKIQFGKKNDPSFESHSGGRKVIMRRPHWERIRQHHDSSITTLQVIKKPKD